MEKRPVGRPTSYKPEYCEQAYKLCLLGADDKRIADFFDVAESTLNKWKLDFPEFSESLKAGKDDADASIAASLYHKAKGYVGKKVVTASFNGQITDSMEVAEYYAPDTTAAIFWLKNRQPKQWRDKQDIDHTSSDGSMTPQSPVYSIVKE